MASERQLQANRRNGRKGGPNTETGKQHSRQNSLTHGLSASTLIVMSEEDPREYEEVLRGFRESFQPHDPVEDALVLRLAHAHWRSLRSRRVETGILSITAATERALAKKIVEDAPEHLNPHNAIAVGFMKNPAERWQMYLRYDTTISRDFFRTLNALTRLQRARQSRNPLPKPALAAAAGAQSAVSDSGIRSVSQNSPIHSDLNQRKELTTHRSTRLVAHQVGRKERNLWRLSAAARVLPAIARPSSKGNHHRLGRQRKSRNQTPVVNNVKPRVIELPAIR